MFLLKRVPNLWLLRMPVHLAQYLSTAGIFNNQNIIRNLKFEEFPIWKWSNNLFKLFFTTIPYLSLCLVFIEGKCFETHQKILYSNFLFIRYFSVYTCIGINGTKKKDKNCLSICHWNLNSVSAYGYSQLFLLNSHNSIHIFDITCLYETYFDSNTYTLVTRWFPLITNLMPDAEVSVSSTKTMYF